MRCISSQKILRGGKRVVFVSQSLKHIETVGVQSSSALWEGRSTALLLHRTSSQNIPRSCKVKNQFLVEKFFMNCHIKQSIYLHNDNPTTALYVNGL